MKKIPITILKVAHEMRALVSRLKFSDRVCTHTPCGLKEKARWVRPRVCRPRGRAPAPRPRAARAGRRAGQQCQLGLRASLVGGTTGCQNGLNIARRRTPLMACYVRSSSMECTSRGGDGMTGDDAIMRPVNPRMLTSCFVARAGVVPWKQAASYSRNAFTNLFQP